MAPHEKDFCQFLLHKLTLAESYKQAFHKHFVTDTLATILATKLMKKTEIQHYLKEQGYEINTP